MNRLTLMTVPVALFLSGSLFAGWQQPPQEILDVLHAPVLPSVRTSPTGAHLLLSDPVTYPPLSELAAPMHELAGMRVNPAVSKIHGRHGGTSPRLVAVEDGVVTPLDLPDGAEVHGVAWTADGRRFALTVLRGDELVTILGRPNPGLAVARDIAHARRGR